jgi:Na+/melibiose symporter-like transporter
MSEGQESDVIDGQLYNLPWGFTVGEIAYLERELKERSVMVRLYPLFRRKKLCTRIYFKRELIVNYLLVILAALIWTIFGVFFVKYVRDPRNLLESLVWIFIAGPMVWTLAVWFGILCPLKKKLLG